MTEQDINRAAQNPQIIRNHRKITEAVESAAVVNEVVARYGSFDAYLRSFGSPDEEISQPTAPLPGPRRLLGVVVHAVGRPAYPADPLIGTQPQPEGDLATLKGE